MYSRLRCWAMPKSESGANFTAEIGKDEAEGTGASEYTWKEKTAQNEALAR